MSNRGGVMSEETKYKLANELGFGDKVADHNWDDVTTGEVGSMVREAIKRGSEAIDKESSAAKNTAALPQTK